MERQNLQKFGWIDSIDSVKEWVRYLEVSKQLMS